MVKIISNARKSYNFECLEESDESHFAWQAQHIVDLKVEKGDFAAQAQGFVKVTRLRRSYIGICNFRGVLTALLHGDLRCRFVCSEVRFCEKSRVKRSFWKLGLSLLVKVSWKMLVLEAWIVTFGESLVENACFGSLDCHFW